MSPSARHCDRDGGGAVCLVRGTYCCRCVFQISFYLRDSFVPATPVYSYCPRAGLFPKLKFYIFKTTWAIIQVDWIFEPAGFLTTHKGSGSPFINLINYISTHRLVQQEVIVYTVLPWGEDH